MARNLVFILLLSISSTGCWRVMLVASPGRMAEMAYRRFPPVKRRRSSRTRARSSARRSRTTSVQPSPDPPSVSRQKKAAGQGLLKDALRCFEEFNYSMALNQFGQAIAAGGMDQSDTATCHFYRGAIFMILEQKDKAIQEFQKCKTICPDYAPSREIFRPDVIALYEACGKD